MTTATLGNRTVEIFGNNEYSIPEELSILEESRAPENHGMFRIMSQRDGDKRVVWDRMSLIEINAAKNMFNSLVAQGMVPYVAGGGATPSSTVMREFDPHAGEVIFMPMRAIVGG